VTKQPIRPLAWQIQNENQTFPDNKLKTLENVEIRIKKPLKSSSMMHIKLAKERRGNKIFSVLTGWVILHTSTIGLLSQGHITS
jgi:hypothetical protein